MKENFSEFLQKLENTLKSVFYERADINTFSQQRGLPPLVMREIMATNPFSVAVPSEYGGRGVKVHEILSVMSAASYESLPLSLTFGINMALFMQPVAKYANESVKPGIFKRFLEKQNMGGLMITEPDFGSDALGMQTSNSKSGNHYHIKGTKHWQGLTGMADYWLITSRAINKDGELNRDIDFFVADVTQQGQQVKVEEYFDNLGLYMIPYGVNKLDLKIPEQFKLQPQTTGIKLMLDTLLRSRMHFPGMGMGFIQRMLDEAIKHCKNRIVGGTSLLNFDSVQHQIAQIQSFYTVTSAMCLHSSHHAGIEHDLSNEIVKGNSMKALVTDYMQKSAHLLVQLSGARGYRLSHIGGRGIVDSRPFQIFEGSNEMLYTQISESLIKLMKRSKETNLLAFLKNYTLTKEVANLFAKHINVELSYTLPQRKLVDLGKIIALIVNAGFVSEMALSGYRKDLIDNSLNMLATEVAALVSTFNHSSNVQVIEDYKEASSWLNFYSGKKESIPNSVIIH